MRQFIIDSYNGVMSAKYNPLKYIPDENTKHILMLGLMWMWATVFALWSGTMFYLGGSIFFHSLLFFGLLVTLGTFKMAKSYTAPARVRHTL
jgi:hypothetical protein